MASWRLSGIVLTSNAKCALDASDKFTWLSDDGRVASLTGCLNSAPTFSSPISQRKKLHLDGSEALPALPLDEQAKNVLPVLGPGMDTVKSLDLLPHRQSGGVRLNTGFDSVETASVLDNVLEGALKLVADLTLLACKGESFRCQLNLTVIRQHTLCFAYRGRYRQVFKLGMQLSIRKTFCYHNVTSILNSFPCQLGCIPSRK